MKENLAKSVEILTHAMETLMPAFESAVADGNGAVVNQITGNMCSLSRTITDAVRTQSDFTPDVAKAIIERMKIDWDGKAKAN